MCIDFFNGPSASFLHNVMEFILKIHPSLGQLPIELSIVNQTCRGFAMVRQLLVLINRRRLLFFNNIH